MSLNMKGGREEEKRKDTRDKGWTDKGREWKVRWTYTDRRMQGGRDLENKRKKGIHFTTNFCEMPRKSLSTRSLIFSQNLKERINSV